MVNRIFFQVLKYVLGICVLSVSNVFSQPTKNVLRIWFDTITVKTVPSQVVMNCWFKLEGTKPHDFRGFQMPYIYESHQIAPTNCFFSGTACENASYHWGGVTSTSGNASVNVLSSSELDLKKQLLFSIAFIALPRLNDTANSDYTGYMEVERNRFELSINSGIDEVIITDGWIRYAKQLPPEPDKRVSLNLSSDSVIIKADSSDWVSIQVNSLDSAKIKQCVFAFSLDTTVVSFDTAVVGAALDSTARISIEKSLSKYNLYLSGIDTSKAFTGLGELMRIKLKAKKREDTTSTYLYDSSFFALNTDNRLDSVQYNLNSIVVQGMKADTIVKSIGIGNRRESRLSILPNPASDHITIDMSIRGGTVELFSVLGEKVFSRVMYGKTHIDTKMLPSGWYQVHVDQGTDQLYTRLYIQH